MYKTRLISSLKTLTHKELQRFHAFVSSPFYNKNPRVLELLDLLIPHAPQYEGKELDRENIFMKLFPKETFQEQKLRLETSALFMLFKQFLATLALESDPHQTQLYLLSELRARNNPRVFESEVKTLVKTLESDENINAGKYFARYRLEAEKNVFFGQEFLRKYDPSLQDKVDNLDLYFLSIKLKETCEMLNRQAILKPGYQIRMTQELVNLLNQDDFYVSSSPLIAIYFQILQMLLQPEELSCFYNLTELLKTHYQKFEHHESRGMFKQAQNYCIRKINRGQEEFLSDLFSLYEQQLDNQIILTDGHISPTDFKNIVTLGLRLKKFDWVKNFLEKYGQLIYSEHQDSIYNYNYANYLVSMEKKSEAIKLLQTVKFTDPYIQISARALLLKIFYETADTNTTLYHLDAFIIFLRRNKKIATSNRQSMLNFLKITRRLILLKDKKGIISSEEFEQQAMHILDLVEQTNPTAEKKWIREKLGLIL
ncbi:MAG: hypothetical protein KDD99_04710 [Bacteroidetes bacterium]|nr:hypothetical protein [Bacteroidota bacterium]